MTSEIHAALCAIGINSTLLRAAVAREAFARPIGERYVMISINNRLKLPDVRKFAVMIDHPCTRYADLVDGDPASSTLGWVDMSHLPAAAAVSAGYNSIFLPHAGPDPVAQPLPASERPIDLFFSGSLGPSWDRESWAAQHPSLPAAVTDLIFAAVDRLARTFEPVLPVLLAVSGERGLDLQRSVAPEALSRLVTMVQGIAETNRRNAVLAALPDIAITVASTYLPPALAARKNIRHLGYVDDFSEIRRLMGQSKIVLNTTSKFPAGSHERIWFGMAEGAALLTDHSDYLDRYFADAASILYLPQRPLAPGSLDYLADLVHDAPKLDAITDRATAIYRDHHTWKHRATLIDEALNRQ